MSAKKSLYDLLEVSTVASADAIRASFDRLTAKFDQGTLQAPAGIGLDAQAHYNLIKDAYFTLGNPVKREAYDKRLSSTASVSTSPAMTYYEDAPGMPWRTKLILFALAVSAALYAFKMHKDSEVEAARLLAEAKQAELEKTEKQKEIESQVFQRVDRVLDDQQTAQQRAGFERARMEADQNSRQLQRTQEQYKREDERQRQEEERRRQNEARQQQYRADIERQRAIAASQQRDYSRPKAAAIENKPERLSSDR
jgi:curved DNA-binding protein CbpA